MVVPVYREKSRIYVLSAAPNFYLVQLAELLRCSGRDWLRPGGAARAGALLVRPSLRRAPAGLERCGSGCPAQLVAASLLPGAAALALGPGRGLQAPRARCGGVGVIVGRLLLLAMLLRRHGVE